MIFSFALNKENISCDKICHNIQKIINDYKNNGDLGNSVVVIEIKPIIDSQNNLEPLKITYENNGGLSQQNL